MQVELTKEQWEQLLSLAERGASTTVAALAQQPGNLKRSGEIATVSNELIENVLGQLKETKEE